MSTDTLATAKAALRQQVSQDIFDRLTELQKERPGVPFETVFAELQTKEVDLFKFADRIERGEWDPPKQPAYRYIDKGEQMDINSILSKYGTQKVHGVGAGAKEGAVLVEADHADRLHKETQKLIDRTDGPLHRDIAQHLIRDVHPGLDDRAQQDEDLANAQMEIKRRISEMQTADPKKTFRQCWESLQRTDPQLFEELPSA
jgi:hypothetical protein